VTARLTVVTPSLNQARFLERTIRSVLDQSFDGLEYFILDGGSTDGSVEIIRRYAARLAGWGSGPDAGQADAIARGFARGTAPAMGWINSSDVYTPGALERAARALEAGAELVWADIELIDEEDRVLYRECMDHLDLDSLLYENVFPYSPGAFWTRPAYEAVGGLDRSFHYYMDLDLFARLARRGKMRSLGAPLARLRRHAGAKTAGARAGWARERERILRAYLPGPSPLLLRRSLSLAKRAARFAAEGRFGEARELLRRAGRGKFRSRPGSA